MSFALPAWAASAAKIFVAYSPFSWVVAGFAGLLGFSLSVAAFGWGSKTYTRSKYDNTMLAKGALIDPLAKTFEKKRIFLNEFLLPSHPYCDGKTFIDCEIVGPANIYLEIGNNINEPKLPRCDAVLLDPSKIFYNGYIFRNCTFRGCSFLRVTFFFNITEHPNAKNVEWLNWISNDSQGELPFMLTGEAPATLSLPSIEPETQQ